MLKVLPVIGVLVALPVLRGNGDLQVPRSLGGEATRPVLEFAMLVANASVPSGVEIRHADATWFRQLQFDNAQTDTVSASTVVARFNEAHEDYRAAMKDGVLVIRPIEQANQFLNRASTLHRGLVRSHKR